MKTLARVVASLVLACPTFGWTFFIPSTMPVREYVNRITGHYLITNGAEEAAIRAGAAGPGWEPTGFGMEVLALGSPGYETATPLCRFYSAVNNSHFYTADGAECAALKDPRSGLAFEGTPYRVITTSAGGCQAPVYRLYNNHGPGDEDHRYLGDAALRQKMIAAGWVDEGEAFCAASGRGPTRTFSTNWSSPILPTDQCEARVGSCVALGNLPAMPNFVPRGPFGNENPNWPPETMAITAMPYDINTAQPVTNAAAIAAHSFVQLQGGGMHVASIDRTGGDLASISLMYQLPRTPEEKVFPWKRGAAELASPPRLDAVFSLWVARLRRADTQSQAYGALLLQFTDAASSRSFFATVQVYGTVPPADFAGPDANGQAYVSTVFRADPLFGQTIAGRFTPCTGSDDLVCNPGMPYKFRLDLPDFENLLARARAIDPRLSADSAGYFVGQVKIVNEIYRDADLGLAALGVGIDVY